MVWKNGSINIVWQVDDNGNWLSQSAPIAGTSADLRVLEPAFNQEPNGSGAVDSRTVIEASGSTTLAGVANFCTLSPSGNLFGQCAQERWRGGTQGSWCLDTGSPPRCGDRYRLAWKNGSATSTSPGTSNDGNWVSEGAIVGGGTWWA